MILGTLKNLHRTEGFGLFFMFFLTMNLLQYHRQLSKSPWVSSQLAIWHGTVLFVKQEFKAHIWNSSHQGIVAQSRPQRKQKAECMNIFMGRRQTSYCLQGKAFCHWFSQILLGILCHDGLLLIRGKKSICWLLQALLKRRVNADFKTRQKWLQKSSSQTVSHFEHKKPLISFLSAN